jgi:hypothetical protein
LSHFLFSFLVCFPRVFLKRCVLVECLCIGCSGMEVREKDFNGLWRPPGVSVSVLFEVMTCREYKFWSVPQISCPRFRFNFQRWRAETSCMNSVSRSNHSKPLDQMFFRILSFSSSWRWLRSGFGPDFPYFCRGDTTLFLGIC